MGKVKASDRSGDSSADTWPVSGSEKGCAISGVF